MYLMYLRFYNYTYIHVEFLCSEEEEEKSVSQPKSVSDLISLLAECTHLTIWSAYTYLITNLEKIEFNPSALVFTIFL